MRLIDPAIALAKKLDAHIGSPKFVNEFKPSFSNFRFCVTSDQNGFATRSEHWLGIRPEVQLVSLRSEACVF